MTQSSDILMALTLLFIFPAALPNTVLPPNTRFLGPGIFRVLEIRELEVRVLQLLIHDFSVNWKYESHNS